MTGPLQRLPYLCFLFSLACISATPGVSLALDAKDAVRVDMTQWHRRDWDNCEDPTRIEISPKGEVRIRSESSTALFWQVPTVTGEPLALDSEEHRWLRKCERPPRDFEDRIQRSKPGNLIDVSDYRYFRWRWKVDESTIREHRVGDNGKLDKKYDDFPVKIGISMLKKGSNSIREVAYVWSKNLPDQTMFWTETTIIPKFWTLKWTRYVIGGEEARMGEWVTESRNLYADYKRAHPDEEPGEIVRVYLMTDSDNTESRTDGSYAELLFSRQP